jgi:hypothetical protein
MKLWVGRYIQSTPLVPSAVLSLGVHATLIGAWVAGSMSAGVDPTVPVESTIARFLAPPNRSAGQQPQPEMIRYVALSIPTPGVGVAVQPVDSITAEPLVSGLDERDARALPELPGADSVFSVVDVDSAASRYDWSAAPAYPPTMLKQNLGGFVRAEWVVDEEGFADTTSLSIVEATHSEFAKSVRDALPYMRFRPAKIGRRTVRQLVQQSFTFRVTPPAADTAAAQTPPR